MAGKYLITGVQIGMLQALEGEDKIKLLKEIEANQWIGNTSRTVEDLCNDLLIQLDDI